MHRPPIHLRISNTLLSSSLHHILCLELSNAFPVTDSLASGPSLLLTDSLNTSDQLPFTILILSFATDVTHFPDQLAGAVCETDPLDELLFCIEAISRGRRYISPQVVDQVRRGSSEHPLLNRLSRREREILHWISLGHTTPCIADRLCISPTTVEGHRAKIQEKLELKGPHCLVKFASRLHFDKKGGIPPQETGGSHY